MTTPNEFDPRSYQQGGQPGGYQQGGQPGGYPAGYPGASGPGGGAHPGTLGIRFLARFIDGILVSIVALLLAYALDSLDNYWVTGLFSGLLTFIYFVAFEVTQGWTPGKKMLGMEVRAPGGAGKPTFKESAIRNAFTLLAIIP